MPSAKITKDDTFSIVSDYLGTPVLAYNGVGNQVWKRELDIYGNIRVGDSIFVPFLYQGQYYDNETELAYNRFRYYSPQVGTYISQDPIGLLGKNPNQYAYVRDVNNRIDVFGLTEQSRDALGKFLPKNPDDAIPGSDAVTEVMAGYEADPKYEILGEEISFKDENNQIRRYDIVVKDVTTNEIVVVEVKASETASYGSKQKAFDDKVNTGNHKVQPTGKKAKDAGITKIDKTTVIRCNK